MLEAKVIISKDGETFIPALYDTTAKKLLKHISITSSKLQDALDLSKADLRHNTIERYK